MTHRAVLLTGGGGAGKTTVAQALGRQLTAGRHPTAVVDLDAISQFGPGRPVSGGLRFHDQLRVRNLAAVWPTYRAAGARYLIVSGHVLTAELRTAYTSALPECAVQVVKLHTPPDLVAERTRTTRHPDWDLQAALAEADTHESIQDFTITNERTPGEAACEILTKLGWPTLAIA